MPKLSLYWPHDLNGYRIEPARPADAKILGEDLIIGARVVRKGGRIDMQTDVFQVTGLYKFLAQVQDEESLLNFVDRFGLLWHGDGQPVDQIYNAASTMRMLIKLRRQDQLLDLLGWFAGAGIKAEFRVEPRLPLDGFFQPATLRDAALLQFFFDVAEQIEIRRCERPGCGNFFRVGRSAGGKKKGARFCSPRCQRMHQYLTKTKVKGRRT